MSPEDYHKQFYRLIVALNRIDEFYYRFAKSTGIKENTIALLYALADGEPKSQKQICEEWLIPKTTLNTIIKELSASGMLVLLNEEGKKEKIISLTEKGEVFADLIMGKCREAEKAALEKTLEQISPEFIDAFEVFSAKLEEEFAKLIR